MNLASGLVYETKSVFCSFAVKVRLIYSVLAVAALFMCPQQTPGQPKSAPDAQRVVKIPVWVENAGGDYWSDGKRQAFKVFVDEKETSIKSFQGPHSPTILLVVFDTVVDLARVEQARVAISDAVKNLGKQYWVGILRAQNGLTVLQEPTADRELITQVVSSIEVSGKAGLLDTLEPVSRLATAMLQKASVRLAVLYVTDGGIANYRADYLNPVINSSDRGDLSRRFSDRAVQERISSLSSSLESYSVPLFILHVARRDDALNLAYQGGIEQIAALSGGDSFFCRTPDEIRPSLDALLARIRGTYYLAFETPPATAKRRPLKLRIVLRDPASAEFSKVKYASEINFARGS